MIAKGQYNELMDTIVSKYKRLESQCRFVLCEGTDYSGVSSALEFDFNADVASNHRGSGDDRRQRAGKITIQTYRCRACCPGAFEERNCKVLATCVNRIEPAQLESVAAAFAAGQTGDKPVFLLPADANLEKPTVGDILRALDARLLSGEAEGLDRVALDYKVAAMQLPLFLEYITEGTLVITPGDRVDIQIGSLATPYFPELSLGCRSCAHRRR